MSSKEASPGLDYSIAVNINTVSGFHRRDRFVEYVASPPEGGIKVLYDTLLEGECFYRESIRGDGDVAQVGVWRGRPPLGLTLTAAASCTHFAVARSNVERRTVGAEHDAFCIVEAVKLEAWEGRSRPTRAIWKQGSTAESNQRFQNTWHYMVWYATVSTNHVVS